MSKARRKLNKGNRMNRLIKESLILSFTRFASSRAVRFFESGLASVLLKSVDKVDRFAKDKIARPIFKKLELRKNFTVPIRNRFASFLTSNTVFYRLNRLVQSFINASLRSVGVFMLTFSIYSIAAFLIRRYITTALGEADVSNLCVSAVTLLVGLLLTLFGEKSVINALGGGKITGSLLSYSLGINDSTFERTLKEPPKLSLGTSFLLGSVFGLLTVFVSPASVLFAAFSLALLIGILNVPEFGLLLGVATVSFASKDFVASVAFATVISHFIKWMRLKRNLRFGTADAVMVIFMLMMFVSGLASGQKINGGEFDLLVFFAIYFAAKNLICTKKLLSQCFSALKLGLAFGMFLYILGEFAAYIPMEHLKNAAVSLTSNVLEPDMLAMLVSAVMPFSIASLLFFKNKNGLGFFTLAIICVVITDSPFFYVMTMAALFVFVMFAYKAPVGGALGALTVMVPASFVIYNMASASEVAAFTPKFFDSILETQFIAKNFWEGLNILGGPLTVFVFVIAVVMVMQRIISVTYSVKSSLLKYVCGTVSASIVMILISMTVFNPLSDVRMVLMMFFAFGLCGSIYKLCVNSQNNYEEV